jgi:hypothetical protein
LKGIRESLSDCIDCVLSVRDGIGASLAGVSIIHRRWAGERVGDGTFTDQVTPLKPTPQIRDYSHDVRVSEAGSVKQGDLILVGVSRSAFPDEATLRTDVRSPKEEKMIKVGRHFYRTVHVREKLVTWDLHIRKINQDETEKET